MWSFATVGGVWIGLGPSGSLGRGVLGKRPTGKAAARRDPHSVPPARHNNHHPVSTRMSPEGDGAAFGAAGEE